jgi:phospholipid/cholesterol/gamma-HCH transport system substrate-binding protein
MEAAGGLGRIAEKERGAVAKVSGREALKPGRSPLARVAALGALLIIVVTVGYLLLGGNGGNHYKLVFETGGQLVRGNQVLIGGKPVGTIDDIKLTDSAQAEVDVTVDRPLHEGTSAVIRTTSLSGVANRYVSITPGPDNAPELADGGIITQVDTTAPVDLDQLFNTLREPERKALQDIIQGSAVVYGGPDYEKGILTGAEDANETYKYLSPSLVATDRLLQELGRDEGVLTNFLVNGASVVGAVAERRDDLSGLVSNSNKALGAIASQNQALDRALVALPPALRQANTTFFNLRGALDDLDPLVNTSKTATKDLAPFLRQLKPVVKKSVPVFHDLRRSVDRKGKSNDLADAAGDLAPLESRASGAIPAAVSAMQQADDELQFLRAYSPDILSAIGGLGRAAGYYDADGHYIRTVPSGMGVFCYDQQSTLPQCPGATAGLNAIPVSQIFDDFGVFGTGNYKVFRRCPGGATQPIAGSNPFSSPPFLGPPAGAPVTPGDCLATDVLP